MIAKIYGYLAPFIAACVASWITYYFTLRQKKHELLLQEKLHAFKAIQAYLVSLRRYCEAGIAEVEGGDFNPTFESLPENDPKSALIHSTALQNVIDSNLIFISHSARKALNELIQQVYMLCSMELAISSDPELKSSSPSGYSATIREVENCINILYSELKLPN